MNALTPAPKPATAVEPAKPSLSDLTAKVKADHEALRESMKYIVNRAITIGDDLNVIKVLVGHGNFLKHVKDNCDITDKTAERYMNLANNKEKLYAALKELGDKFESISNLSLARAERLIEGGRGSGGGGGGSEKYDAVQKKLLKKLSDEPNADNAEAMASETIKKLVEIVKIKKPDFKFKLVA